MTENHLPEWLTPLLSRVQMPGQYIGREPNIIVKPEADLRLALAFPDTYSIGMSHLGMHVLYEQVNRIEGFAAERVYAPLPDMEEQLRHYQRHLYTLETYTPLKDCDVVGFSMQYELGTSAMLTMLDLGGIELFAEKRTAGAPIVIMGGHVAMNPEPYADFIDLFVHGEAEESLPELLKIVRDAGGRNCGDRLKLFARLMEEVDGVYAPALCATTRNQSGMVVVEDTRVRRRVYHGFASSQPPLAPVVPVVQAIHERVMLEIMRGCPNGCRFCQAGMICRPVRERNVDGLVAAAEAIYTATGYDEIGLLSLSSSDYSQFDQLVEKLDGVFSPLRVNLSLPSLRVDHALSGIPKRFKSVRKSGFTIAPEAGTDRLRSAINKDVTNENLLEAAKEAFAQGWQTIKLYFMIGLPGEREEDVHAIAHLANQVARLRGKGGRKPAVNLAVSNFVPKAHTPLQWAAMDSRESLKEKSDIIGRDINRKRVSFKYHDVQTTWLEAVLARGDRQLGKVIHRAWQLGTRLDAWTDYFRPQLWQQAFQEAGIDGDGYISAERDREELQPWSHIESGVSVAFLRREADKVEEEVMTPACTAQYCPGCGIEGCSTKGKE